jgi:hypothetical protein
MKFLFSRGDNVADLVGWSVVMVCYFSTVRHSASMRRPGRLPRGLGLGPAWGGAGLVGIDEHDAEAFGLEQVVKGDPVDAGGSHGDGIDLGAARPVGQAARLGGAGAEAADVRGQVVGASGGARGHGAVGDGDPRLACAYVDAGGVGVEGLHEGEFGGVGLGGSCGAARRSPE